VASGPFATKTSRLSRPRRRLAVTTGCRVDVHSTTTWSSTSVTSSARRNRPSRIKFEVRNLGPSTLLQAPCSKHLGPSTLVQAPWSKQLGPSTLIQAPWSQLMTRSYACSVQVHLQGRRDIQNNDYSSYHDDT
jgi:hypothetical protein